MIPREDALDRLALDPIHYGLLRQLSEAWDRRLLVKSRRVIPPPVLAELRMPPTITERETNRELDEAIVASSRDGQIVVFRDIRWYREMHPYTGAEGKHEPPETSAFADHDDLIRWARNANMHEIAICCARALLIPPLPAGQFDTRSPDGSVEKRPGVHAYVEDGL